MIRSLIKNWKLNSIAVLSLSVAMALAVVALSVSNAILLRPPFARDPGKLVTIFTVNRVDAAPEGFSYPNYQHIRDHSRSFSGVAALRYSLSKQELSYRDHEEIAMVNTVSDNYFDVMGIEPFLGRFFAAGDDRKQTPVAVLTYACWRRWGADLNIAGKTLDIYRRRLTIIGVAPRQFIAPVFGVAADVILTIGVNAAVGEASLEDRQARSFHLAGRLKPRVARAQARAEVQALWGQLSAAYPEVERDRAADLIAATALPPDAIRTARVLSAVLVAAALLILLIACANTTNLLLALATGRRQEALIKTALGAPRLRLIGEFLRETAGLCAAGGLLGFVLATLALARLSRFEVDVPSFGSFSIATDLHPGALVVALTLGLVLLTSLVSGLAPALYASKPNLASALSGEIAIGGTRRGVIRNAIVVIQVAVCTLVLAGAGLCLRSVHNLRQVDPGFSARRVLLLLLFFDSTDTTRDRQFRLYDQVRRGTEKLPGVEAVSLAGDVPLGGGDGDHDEVRFTDRPANGQKTIIESAVVDENYFSTLGIRLVEGRAFRSSDDERSPKVIVINHFMAEKFWPHQDPIGRTIRMVDGNRLATVIGVVADGKYSDLDEPQKAFLYHSLRQHFQPGIRLIVRTSGDPRLWAEPISRMVRQLGLKLPLPPATMESWMNLTLFIPLLTLACVTGLSVLGVLLATVGLYGAISYSVRERRRELGIRIALGAQPSQVLQLVFGQTLLIAGSGVVAGLALGIAAGAIFRSQFFGIHTVEWQVLVPVGSAMVASSLAIAFAAARRWTRMNPMDAVRHS